MLMIANHCQQDFVIVVAQDSFRLVNEIRLEMYFTNTFPEYRNIAIKQSCSNSSFPKH